MTRLPSRYTPLHALAAGAVLFCVFAKGFKQAFLHGGPATPPPVGTLVYAVAAQTLLFVVLVLVLWASTLFPKRLSDDDGGDAAVLPPPKRKQALKYALFAFPGVCLVAFALELGSAFVCEHVFGLKLPQQDLVKWLAPGVYPLWVRGVLAAMALVEAPIFEELIFRGVIFRGLLKWNGLWAFVLSGLAFALVHVNAATLLPLFYLGVAFAWLYWKTRTILAPMLVHALFNLLNFVLAVCGLAA